VAQGVDPEFKPQFHKKKEQIGTGTITVGDLNKPVFNTQSM
jgi:hypothetical protein